MYANKRIHWDPHPLCGHDYRVCLRVLYEKVPASRRAAGADRVCRRGHGGGIHLEPALPRHGAVRRAGAAGVPARRYRVLARRRVPASAGCACPPPAPGRGHARRPQKRLLPHDDVGTGCHAAQYPGGHGRRRCVRGILNRQRADHRHGRTGAVPGHCHPELPRRCDHFNAFEGRGHEQGQGVPDGYTVRRGGTAGRTVHDLGGGAGRARAAVSFELCRGCDAVCCYRGTDPRNVPG